MKKKFSFLQLRCKAEVAGRGAEGGSVQPPARQKEHLLYAVVVDKIRKTETSAFAQIQFATRIWNHKKVSPGFIWQHLYFLPDCFWVCSLPKPGQWALAQNWPSHKDHLNTSIFKDMLKHTAQIFYLKLILLQASSAARQLPCYSRGTPGKRSAERRTCLWRQSSCQTTLTSTPHCAMHSQPQQAGLLWTLQDQQQPARLKGIPLPK